MTELATEEKNDEKNDRKNVTTDSLMLIALKQFKFLLCCPKSRGLTHVKNSSHNNPAGKACSNSAVKTHKQGCWTLRSCSRVILNLLNWQSLDRPQISLLISSKSEIN